jgi:hypothetical protein
LPTKQQRLIRVVLEYRELDARRTRVDHCNLLGHVGRPFGCRQLLNCGRRACSPACGEKLRDRTGREARCFLVRPAGEDDRHLGAKHDSRGVGVGKEGQALSQHVAGLKIWNHQDLRLTRDRRFDTLNPRGLGADRIVEGEWAVKDAVRDLTRSAILQRAAASMVEGILVVTVSTAERIATFGVPSPRAT